MKDKIVVITGANRGMGLAMTDKFSEMGATVIMVCRDEKDGKKKLESFKDRNVSLEIADMEQSSSLESLAQRIQTQYDKIDILINNAAVNIDGNASRISNIDIDMLEKTMQINFYAPLLLCKLLLPMIKKSADGRIVNFSSGLGQLSVPRMGPYPAYSISKTAVNSITKILADEVKDDNILVTSVDPGWVRTDLGGPNGQLSIEQGIETPIWLATAPSSEIESGYFYKEKKKLLW